MSLVIARLQILPEWSSIPLLRPYSEPILTKKPTLLGRVLQSARLITCILVFASSEDQGNLHQEQRHVSSKRADYATRLKVILPSRTPVNGSVMDNRSSGCSDPGFFKASPTDLSRSSLPTS